jgi:chitin synthase
MTSKIILLKGIDVEKLIAKQYNLKSKFATDLVTNKADNEENLFWLTQEETLKHSEIAEIEPNEITFWKKLIKKYLFVEKMEPAQKHKLQMGLNDMRDRGVFAFFMLNALWIAFVFPVLLAQDRLKDMLYIPIPIPSLYYQPVLIEPLGVLHLAFFTFISLVQFIAMLCHRYNTFQHILASTKLRSNIHEGMRIEDIIDTVKMLQQIKVTFRVF